MALRTILVSMEGGPRSAAAMELAFQLGRDHGAYVEVLHVRPDFKAALPLLGEGMSGAMVEEMIDQADGDEQSRSRHARKRFDERRAALAVPLRDGAAPQTARGRLCTAWVELEGREDDVVARRGRLFDLVAVGHPGGPDQPSVETLHAALLETGRPVLVAPLQAPSRIGRTIAIAWNGSAEATRAVSAALPLLERAERVHILSGDEGPSVRSSAELVDHLAWHGIAAQPRSFKPAGLGIGKALLAEARAVDADLMVMGAYTHGRLRQMILGGATRHIFEYADLPILMAH